jgi:hypothetical protein
VFKPDTCQPQSTNQPAAFKCDTRVNVGKHTLVHARVSLTCCIQHSANSGSCLNALGAQKLVALDPAHVTDDLVHGVQDSGVVPEQVDDPGHGAGWQVSLKASAGTCRMLLLCSGGKMSACDVMNVSPWACTRSALDASKT